MSGTSTQNIPTDLQRSRELPIGGTVFYSPKLGYTIEEAAAASGASINCVRTAVSDGSLPSKMIGNKWIISLDELKAWIAK